MQRALRLTITAVGEPDSVFLTPCDPITLHESAIEPDGADQDEQDHRGDSAPAPAENSNEDMLILMMEEVDGDDDVRQAS